MAHDAKWSPGPEDSVIEATIRTADVPARERPDFWCAAVFPALVPVELRTDDPSDFRASSTAVGPGPVQVTHLSCPSMGVHRTPELIRRSDPEVYQVWLTLRGGIGISQGGREAAVGPDEMVIYDSSRPFHGWTRAENGAVTGLMAQFPKAAFPIGPDLMSLLTVVPLSGRTGVGAVLARHLTEVARQARHLTPADGAGLATVTTDLIAAWCAHELRTTARLDPGRSGGPLLARIHRFIGENLGDPALSPTAIAAAHQISLRYLHKLFSAQGITVACWVRRCRLERCRRDLADPLLSPRPVHAVAARWGFTDPTHFGRAFRTAYGLPPRDYRRLALGLPHRARTAEDCALPAEDTVSSGRQGGSRS